MAVWPQARGPHSSAQHSTAQHSRRPAGSAYWALAAASRHPTRSTAASAPTYIHTYTVCTMPGCGRAGTICPQRETRRSASEESFYHLPTGSCGREGGVAPPQWAAAAAAAAPPAPPPPPHRQHASCQLQNRRRQADRQMKRDWRVAPFTCAPHHTAPHRCVWCVPEPSRAEGSADR